MLQSHRNQSVVRQPNAFKSKRPGISKPRCDSQVDVNYDLSKPVTTHYFPKEREVASAKPHHMIASSNSRISSKNMPRFSSNDMVHNHYLEEAKKNTQEHNRNSRIDSCVTKFLKEVNSRAKVPSNKTTNRNKPVEQISVAKKPERQIPKGHRFSIQKTSIVQKKTMTPRSCLRWQSTGKIFKTFGLRWVPTGKIFAFSTPKVDSEPLNGSNADITNQNECEQTLDVSAGTLDLSAGLQIHQSPRGIFINQAKYALEILHKHGMDKGQSIVTPMAMKPKLDVDLSGNPVVQTNYRSKIRSLMYLTSSRPDIVQALFSYADHARCIDSRKSTYEGIQFLGDKLVSWMSKKQDCTAMSSVEAEYVALSASCAQVIIEYQLADTFTKALPEDRFKYLIRRIGMRCLTRAELEVLAKESA
uniref:Reverse transcriptase Ty1/copia-type domain-containing protein n=1 Tax=Tanacetum cinerariifolium TaxID=118510 RepID=A0A6L2ME53_TANCI|nr:hypothetical protein [Tanacetum cinerariifolium]